MRGVSGEEKINSKDKVRVRFVAAEEASCATASSSFLQS